MSGSLALVKEGLFLNILRYKTELDEHSQTPSVLSPGTFSVSLRLIFVKLTQGGFPEEVFVYCSLLMQRLMARRLSSLNSDNLERLFATCFFLSQKLVLDENPVYLKEFAILSGINAKVIELLEIGILCKILAFKLPHDRDEFVKEQQRLTVIAERNALKYVKTRNERMLQPIEIRA